ncbi:MAG: mechanosensitive ion channel, partial [Rhodospirillaceae bacterium]
MYWLTFLLFLPAILNALQLGGLLEPVRGMVDEVLAFFPNLLASALILAIGWLAARIIRKITVNVLSALGTDRLSERVGLDGSLGSQSLSGLVGLVVYILILVPVIVASLNALHLDAITAPASQMLVAFLAALPKIFAATVLLFIAFVVGRIIGGFVENLLSGVGLDGLVARMGFTVKTTDRQRMKVSKGIGRLVLIAILFFAAIEALYLVGFDAVGDLGTDFLTFAGNIIVGIIVIGLGLYFANLAAAALRSMKIANADILAIVARAAITILAVAVGLGEMGLATEIIALAFGILFGAIALA